MYAKEVNIYLGVIRMIEQTYIYVDDFISSCGNK